MLTQPTGEAGPPGGRAAWGRKAIVVLAAVGLSAVVLVLASALGFLSFGERTTDRSEPPMLVRLTDLSEYHAASASFEVMVDLEKGPRYVPSFISGERSRMVAAGTVDATVDFSGLGDENVVVSNGGDTITITLPPAYVDDVVLDHDKTYVESRSRGLLNRIGGVFSGNPSDDQPLYQAATEQLHEAASNSELRSLAEKNTRAMLETLMESAGFEEVIVRFVEPPRPQ